MSGTTHAPLRLAIVESEPVARFGISQFLKQFPRVQISLEIDSAAKGDQLFGSLQPDLVMVDADIDGGGGFELIRRVTQGQRMLSVAILHRNHPLDIINAMKAGARGIVCRREPLSEIALSIFVVLSGYRHLSDAATVALGDFMDAAEKNLSLPQLPPRQLQVFNLLAEGLRSKEIAERIGISLKTVQTHIERLKSRMRCRDQPALSRLATLSVKR